MEMSLILFCERVSHVVQADLEPAMYLKPSFLTTHCTHGIGHKDQQKQELAGTKVPPGSGLQKVVSPVLLRRILAEKPKAD